MMKSRRRRHREAQRGFTLIEVMVVVLIVSLLGAIAAPAYQASIDTARRVALVDDARNLHSALTRYHVDQGSYPPEFGPGALNVSSLDPLAAQGYFTQSATFLSKLQNSRLLLYIAPDIGGADNQYLAFMRHGLDDSLVVMTADTNLLGTYYEGVYVLDDGTWVRVDEVD